MVRNMMIYVRYVCVYKPCRRFLDFLYYIIKLSEMRSTEKAAIFLVT